MRISQDQQTAIRSAGVEMFGAQVGVWLFGSRVDDSLRGGDIDILLDIPEHVDNPALLAAQFAAKVTRLMSGRKVDVVLFAPNLARLPIHEVAFREGIKL
ncbi:MAG TPA: nucleotidyltransferase domain-containing protein [Burkholderiales bacterium]|nr:nucleotidyltransferase domain-containing protein [Burkholderiales bacterium]